MSYVDRIVAAFGGVTRMAARLDRPISTVGDWKRRCSIPDRHKAEILRAARADGLSLTEADFFPTSDDPASRADQAGGPENPTPGGEAAA